MVGTTHRHCTFFEMLGNFSFGDYFKDEAIPFAWELVTEVLGIDGDRLWVTVHESDDEAEQIWHRLGGRAGRADPAPGRGQLLEDGGHRPVRPQLGDLLRQGTCLRRATAARPSAGPSGSSRSGTWCSCSTTATTDGATEPLPRPSIDTGAGLERILPVLQGVDSIFATDLFVPMIETAQSITGHTYGEDERADVGLRILADHGRAMSMLVADGVLPANEGRGYVLRRIIRRAVRRARQLGVDEAFTTRLVDAAVGILGAAYPALAEQHQLITDVVAREEEGFLRTLATGSTILEEELASGAGADLRRCGLPAPRHLRLPGRAHRGDRRGGRGHGRPRGLRGGHGPAAGPGPGRGRRRQGRRPARRPTARCWTPRARPVSSASDPTGTRPRPGWWRCWSTAIPIGPARWRSSSTAPRSTPRAGDRSATPAPSSPRPGRPWSTTRSRRCPG